MENILIILTAFIALIGAFDIAKESKKSNELSDSNFLVRGASVINKRKKYVLIIVILIIVSATSFFFIKKIQKDNKLLEEENIRLTEMREREITLNKLTTIIESPQQDKEFRILGLDFNINGKSDDGYIYSRDTFVETIQNWYNGIIEYRSKRKEDYVRIREKMEKEGFDYKGEELSGTGDLISIFHKNNIKINTGIITESNEYLISLQDTTKVYTPPTYLRDSDFVGTWERQGEEPVGRSGLIVVSSDHTFYFNDHSAGKIYGKWIIDKRDIILKYKTAYSRYYSHPLSKKTEIIKMEKKDENKIIGELTREMLFKEVTLVKIE